MLNETKTSDRVKFMLSLVETDLVKQEFLKKCFPKGIGFSDYELDFDIQDKNTCNIFIDFKGGSANLECSEDMRKWFNEHDFYNPEFKVTKNKVRVKVDISI